MRFEVGFKGLDRLRALPERIAVRLDEAEKTTVRLLQQVGSRALRKRLTGEDRNVRTGNLRRSIAADEPRRIGSTWEGRFGYGQGASSRYARILEEGGTIVPKNAKVLAIPILAGLTAGGRARYSSPRDVEGGFWVSRPGQPPLFAVARGGKNSQRLDILFVGVKRVTIRGKHSAEKAGAEAQGQARVILDAQIRLALEAA